MAASLLAALLPIDAAAINDKERRTVYVHANDDLVNTTNTSTAYIGDTVQVYLAVDDPNKGSYDSATDTHLEPQYDMNGYTVRFYYDTSYFEFAGPNAAEPINYRLPNQQWQGSTVVIDGQEVEQNANVGYYVYRHGGDTRTIDGRTYGSAYITVFFSGTYLPRKPDSDNWYNLCALPLRPLKKGSSDVFIEVDTTDVTTLELFAKNVSDDYSPWFSFTPINNGYHTIIIRDKARPAVPVADPIAGSYTEAQHVKLTAEQDCTVYYSINGSPYAEYTGEFDISMTSEVRCYAERAADGQRSNIVTYEYRILPTAPKLFIDSEGQKQQMPNIYNLADAFTVYAVDSDVFGPIGDDSDVYYTFSQTIASDGETGDAWQDAP